MPGRSAYLRSMLQVVIRTVLLLVLAVVGVTLTIALLSGSTGAAEKIVLVALLAGCVWLAAKVPAFTASLARRLHLP